MAFISAGSGQVAGSTNPLRIGAYAPVNGTVSMFFSGLIDEVSIYSCSLSAAQLLAIIMRAAPGKIERIHQWGPLTSQFACAPA